MKRPIAQVGVYIAASALALAICQQGFAQQVAQPAPTAADSDIPVDDETVILSPFTVSADSENSGYSVKDTLAGSRVRTELKDIASSISVVNSAFLRDTGARNTQDLLVYTTNTEVGGMSGNYSGQGGGSTYNETNTMLRPNTNTRVRGLDSADNTRDYFLTEIPWDGYNVERVDMQRGPNSILFGVGSPAGIINASINTASFKTGNKFENRIGSFGSVRNSLDVNYALIPNQLAVRVTALDDKTLYRQEPAYNRDKRLFTALRFDPKLFGDGNHTSIKANFERGYVRANRPRTLPPVDGLSLWFAKDAVPGSGVPALNQLVLDPNTTWNIWSNRQEYAAMSGFLGRMYNSNMASFYEAGNSTPLRVMVPVPSTLAAIGPDGTVDSQGISAMPFVHLWAPSGYSMFAKHGRNQLPGGAYYSDFSLTDASVYNFYDKLIDGHNKREWQDWKAGNINISQTFLDNRIGFELAYDKQEYTEGQTSILQGGEYLITVDMNTHLSDGSPNPHVGRPAVGSNGQYGNNSNDIERDSLRFTATGELRFEDIFGRSRLSRILGRHVFTGLASRDEKETLNRQWSRWGVDPAFALKTNQQVGIQQGSRQWEYLVYLGDSLLGRSSPSGANLSNLNMYIGPTPTTTLRYFDSTWNAPGVDPSAPYSYPYINTDGSITMVDDSTQSENPANYVGWTTGEFNTLNADAGDINQLTNRYAGVFNKTESVAITWQGYFFDGNLVPTVGWRKDTVSTRAGSAALHPDYGTVIDYVIPYGQTTKVSGKSNSWGVVAHTPRQIREKLPFRTGLSLFYNTSENFKADAARADIAGQLIDNPSASTKEYGFMVTTLDDRLTFKATWYETKMKNANLGYDSAGFGGNLYYAWAVPTWLATHARSLLDASYTDDFGGWPWDNIEGVWSDMANKTGKQPERMREIARAVFMNFPATQEYLDEYGIPFDLAKMHSANEADWIAAVPKANFWDLGLQPAYKDAFRSTGSGPVATADTISKGMEFELTAQPVRNWNITLNASKTEASRVSISPSLDAWVQLWTDYLATDAGLVTMWGGNTFRQEWANNIVAPYTVLKRQQGSSAPEIAPWRFNGVTTYNFNEGPLKGAWIGGAYRWEDKRILGYQYDESINTLDISKPYYGPSDDHFDMWVGYSRQLTKKVGWQIQLNVRNVGEKKKLVPITIQPDGRVAVSRIQEGMTWQITNTFNF
jgi:Outer membrane receptor proteins, mostly Fe transport